MSKWLVLVLACSVVLTACGDKKKDDPAPKHEFALPFNQPSSAKLNVRQRADFMAMRAYKEPSDVTKLVLKPANETAEQLQQRLQKRREAPAGIQNYANMVEQNCTISHPHDLPSQNNGIRGIGAKLTQATVSSVGGDRCSLTADNNMTMNMEVTGADQPNQLMIVQMRIDITNSARAATSGPNANELQVVESQTTSRIEGPTKWYKDQMRSGDLQGTVTQTARFMNGETARVSGTLRVVSRLNGNTTEVEAILHLHIDYRGVDYVVSQRTLKVNGNTTQTETFLNGETAPAELASDFAL